jgi:hypothetical protein
MRCIFTSPLSSEAKCLAFLHCLLEREFERHSVEGRCKIAFALPVGLSLRRGQFAL